MYEYEAYTSFIIALPSLVLTEVQYGSKPMNWKGISNGIVLIFVISGEAGPPDPSTIILTTTQTLLMTD